MTATTNEKLVRTDLVVESSRKTWRVRLCLAFIRPGDYVRGTVRVGDLP